MRRNSVWLSVIGLAAILVITSDKVYANHETGRAFAEGEDRRVLRAVPFDAASTQAVFRVAASDYLDPLFLPQLVARIKSQAPHTRIA